MSADSYEPFEDALDNFLLSAPVGTRATAIRAGERECAEFADWMAQHPSGSRLKNSASFSGAAAVGYYADLPIERVPAGSYLCIVGKTSDGETFEAPAPDDPT